MSFAINILWLFLGGGLVTFGLWILFGILMAITIIGIPFAVIAFRIASYSFWPMGREIIDATLIGEKKIVLTGFVNLIWILLAGLWLAISHAVLGLFYCISIIGIPFGLVHFKLAQASFSPLGKRIVSSEMAKMARTNAVASKLNKHMDSESKA